MPGDVLIFSVGQRVGLGVVPGDAGVNVTRDEDRRGRSEDAGHRSAPAYSPPATASRGTAFVIEAIAERPSQRRGHPSLPA